MVGYGNWMNIKESFLQIKVKLLVLLINNPIADG